MTSKTKYNWWPGSKFSIFQFMWDLDLHPIPLILDLDLVRRPTIPKNEDSRSNALKVTYETDTQAGTQTLWKHCLAAQCNNLPSVGKVRKGVQIPSGYTYCLYNEVTDNINFTVNTKIYPYEQLSGNHIQFIFLHST